MSNSVSPKKSSAPASANAISSRRITPAVALDSPPSSASSAAPAGEVRCWMTARRSARSSSGSAFLSAKWKTRPERRLLHVVEPEHLGQQGRPERRHGGPDRHTLAVAAEGEELDRVRGRLPVVPDLRGPGGDLLARLARRGHAGQVTLDVGQEDRHAGRAKLLGHRLQRLGLAGAGGAGDQPVPVHHRQRDPHLRRRVTAVADHEGAQLQHRPVERIARPNRRRDVNLRHAEHRSPQPTPRTASHYADPPKHHTQWTALRQEPAQRNHRTASDPLSATTVAASDPLSATTVAASDPPSATTAPQATRPAQPPHRKRPAQRNHRHRKRPAQRNHRTASDPPSATTVAASDPPSATTAPQATRPAQPPSPQATRPAQPPHRKRPPSATTAPQRAAQRNHRTTSDPPSATTVAASEPPSATTAPQATRPAQPPSVGGAGGEAPARATKSRRRNEAGRPALSADRGQPQTRGRYWDRTSDLSGVNGALSR